MTWNQVVTHFWGLSCWHHTDLPFTPYWPILVPVMSWRQANDQAQTFLRQDTDITQTGTGGHWLCNDCVTTNQQSSTMFGIWMFNYVIFCSWHIQSLTREELIYNYCLSHTRFVVENTIGILVKRFRCLLKTSDVGPEQAARITLTCCILHNFMRTKYPNRQNPYADRFNR